MRERKPLNMLGPTAAPRPSATPDDTASQQPQADAEAEEQRRATRENARRVLRASGITEMLQTLNQNALQGRGWFEEYDSGLLFKWGTGYTRRHIWIDVSGDSLRFRLRPHLRCTAEIPACDGEYHTFTAQTWRIPGAVLKELNRNYKQPVAEASED